MLFFGGKMRKEQTLDLSRYQPIWQEDFNVEKGKVRAVLGDAAIEIEHIGSTSIEGLLSKPIIDIAVMIEVTKRLMASPIPLLRQDTTSVPNHPAARGISIQRVILSSSTYRLPMLTVEVFGHDRSCSAIIYDLIEKTRDEYTKLKEEFFKYPSATQSDRKADFVYRILRLAGWKAFQMLQGGAFTNFRNILISY